jgi:hypothetical protein
MAALPNGARHKDMDIGRCRVFARPLDCHPGKIGALSWLARITGHIPALLFEQQSPGKFRRGPVESIGF